MFRSVFGGKQEPSHPQPQQLPQAVPVPGDAGLASLNPLSRQRSDAPDAYPGQSGPHMPPGRVPVAYPPQASTSGAWRPPGALTQPAPRRQFPELASLSAEELRQLLTDPEAYSKFLHQVEEVRQLDRVVEELQRSNVELAKSTLSLEGTISELQTQCRIIRGTELAAAREQLQHLLAQQQELYSTLGPSALVAKVQAGADAANKESEVLQRQLSDGDISMSSFIKEYRAKRKLFHLRQQTALAALASYAQC